VKRHPIFMLIAPVPWLMLVAGLISIVFVSFVPLTVVDPGVVLLTYLCGSLPMLFIAITWLMLAHRQIFMSGWGLIIPSIFLVLSSFFVNQPALVGFVMAGEILSLWAIGLATTILLWRRDIGLKLLGWVSAIYIWELAIVTTAQPNFVEFLNQGLNNPAFESPLWELHLNLWCAANCIIPLSLLGVAGHTVRLLWRELH
jgi:hypothetical protein